MTMQRVTLACGIELDVDVTGPDDAPALIFLHGFPESHRTWRHQVPHFADGFRCIAPDQRGYRGSSTPQDVASYTPDQLIGDIVELADALGVQRYTLIGHDWGGAMAWGAALRGQAAGRVSRLVILNAPHPTIFQRLLYLDPVQREASQYIRTLRDPGHDALVREGGLAALLAKAVNWDRSPALEEAERAALAQDWRNREAAFGMLNWYRASPLVVPASQEPYAIPADASLPRLPNVTIPTLVIWAMDDLALPAGNLVGLADVVDDLTVVQIRDCGHFVPWEKPEEVNAALDDFLARTA